MPKRKNMPHRRLKRREKSLENLLKSEKTDSIKLQIEILRKRIEDDKRQIRDNPLY